MVVFAIQATSEQAFTEFILKRVKEGVKRLTNYKWQGIHDCTEENVGPTIDDR